MFNDKGNKKIFRAHNPEFCSCVLLHKGLNIKLIFEEFLKFHLSRLSFDNTFHSISHLVTYVVSQIDSSNVNIEKIVLNGKVPRRLWLITKKRNFHYSKKKTGCEISFSFFRYRNYKKSYPCLKNTKIMDLETITTFSYKWYQKSKNDS